MSRKISNKGYVYMITSPNNRVYIGSTVNFKERFSSYRRMENKAQIKLFNSFNKYGVENHLFEVIWIGDKNQMRKYEAIIGNNFNVIDRGLNCYLPKINEEYKCASDETRDKMRKAKLGTKMSFKTRDAIYKANKGSKRPYKAKNISQERRNELSKNFKENNPMKTYKHSYEVLLKASQSNLTTVLQYNLNGEFIKEWNSFKEAAKGLQIDPSSISHCVRGRFKTAGGFVWKKGIKLNKLKKMN